MKKKEEEENKSREDLKDKFEEEKSGEKSPGKRTAPEIAKEIGEQTIVGIALGEFGSRVGREYTRVSSRSPRKTKSPEDKRTDHKNGVEMGAAFGGYAVYGEIKNLITPEKSKSPTNENQGKKEGEINYYKTGGTGGE
jgi:hypothetical protein